MAFPSIQPTKSCRSTEADLVKLADPERGDANVRSS